MKLNVQKGALLSAELEEGERELVIPEGVTAIGMKVFALNRQIRSVALPESLQRIGAAAFSGCKGLEELSIYEWTEEGSDAFARCDALRRMEVFARKPGEGYSSWTPRLPTLREAVLHEGVWTIPTNAFEDYAQLESVALPSTLHEINGSAFSGCAALSRGELPAALFYIGPDAFSGCRALRPVVPASVTHIGESAFCDVPEVTFLGDLEELSALRAGGLPLRIRAHAGTNIQRLAEEMQVAFEAIE